MGVGSARGVTAGLPSTLGLAFESHRPLNREGESPRGLLGQEQGRVEPCPASEQDWALSGSTRTSPSCLCSAVVAPPSSSTE